MNAVTECKPTQGKGDIASIKFCKYGDINEKKLNILTIFAVVSHVLCSARGHTEVSKQTRFFAQAVVQTGVRLAVPSYITLLCEAT